MHRQEAPTREESALFRLKPKLRCKRYAISYGEGAKEHNLLIINSFVSFVILCVCTLEKYEVIHALKYRSVPLSVLRNQE